MQENRKSNLRPLLFLGFFLVVLLLVLVLYLYRKNADRSKSATFESQSTATVKKSSEPIVIDNSSHAEPTSKDLKREDGKLFKKLSEEEISAIRSSIKISLAASFGSQKSFFSEFGRYSTDFYALGYQPEGPEYSIKAGFLRPFSPRGKSVGKENSSETAYNFDSFIDTENRIREEVGKKVQLLKFSESIEKVDFYSAQQFCKKDCTASENHFEMISVANLDDDPDLDVWLIDDSKTIVHAFDDLAE